MLTSLARVYHTYRVVCIGGARYYAEWHLRPFSHILHHMCWTCSNHENLFLCWREGSNIKASSMFGCDVSWIWLTANNTEWFEAVFADQTFPNATVLVGRHSLHTRTCCSKKTIRRLITSTKAKSSVWRVFRLFLWHFTSQVEKCKLNISHKMQRTFLFVVHFTL